MTPALAILCAVAAGACFGAAVMQRLLSAHIRHADAQRAAAAAQRTALLVAARDVVAAIEPGLPRCRVGMADQFVSAVEALAEAAAPVEPKEGWRS